MLAAFAAATTILWPREDLSMNSKDNLRAFVELLEKGSNDELEARKRLLMKAVADKSLSRDTVADCRFLLRKIQEEQMARAESDVASRFAAQARQA
jgi:hypothetical protein